MPLCCFKKEKSVKKKSGKAPTANGAAETQEVEMNQKADKASDGAPHLDTAKAVEMDLRSPRADRTPKSVRMEEEGKSGMKKSDSSRSVSSSPSYETPRPMSARRSNVATPRGDREVVRDGEEGNEKSERPVENSSKTPRDEAKSTPDQAPKSPRSPKSARSRADSNPKSPRARATSTPKSPRLYGTANAISFAEGEKMKTPPMSPKASKDGHMSARVVPTAHAPDSTPATPVFFSPRPINRRGSTFSTRSRGSFSSYHTNSISQRDWNKIQHETDTAMAAERTRILERKQTLAANVEASLSALRKLEEDAKRQSQELDLNALDDMELDDAEVELAKFKEEDFNEEAMEEKILEQHIVAHLEQDVQETKRALEALNDNDSSMDLNDLDNLSDALDLDDSQDLDGLEIVNEGQDGGSDDESLPSSSIPSSLSHLASSTSNDNINRAAVPPLVSSSSANFDDPSVTEETHTERQGSDTDLSISTGLSPRRHRVHSNGDAKTVDTLA